MLMLLKVYDSLYNNILHSITNCFISVAQYYTYMPIIFPAGLCIHQFHDLQPFEGNTLQVA